MLRLPDYHELAEGPPFALPVPYFPQNHQSLLGVRQSFVVLPQCPIDSTQRAEGPPFPEPVSHLLQSRQGLRIGGQGFIILPSSLMDVAQSLEDQPFYPLVPHLACQEQLQGNLRRKNGVAI
jgi:hypothetical protein